VTRISKQELATEAARRTESHKRHSSQRILSKNHEYVSLVGEEEFSFQSGCPMDMTARPKGDNGIDFRVTLLIDESTRKTFTVDVKTARWTHNLCVEVGKVRADIYVLAGYSDDTETARLVGWAWKPTVLAAKQGCNSGHAILNHKVPARELRKMGDLLERIVRD
jgi:hypothetical protein